MKKLQSLSGDWDLWKAAGPESQPEEKVLSLGKAPVPGSVLQAMLENGQIPDPYWRCNEYEIRERMTDDFIYERTFEVERLEAEQIWLVCQGLDTITSVRLNGQKIADTDDMHRTWRFDVKPWLKAGENQISIRFFSALKAAREEDASNDIFYASTGSIHGNAAIRKAHYMFGWDWGPQLPDAGIFREIYLEWIKEPQIRDLRIRQIHGDEGTVMLKLSTQVEQTAPQVNREDDLWMTVSVEAPDGSLMTETCAYQEELSFAIENPKLWWPNGVGEHPLYQVTVELKGKDGTVFDRCTKRIGLRTITVCREPHEDGQEFAFVVNGVKIFAMGANYVPEDNLLSRVNRERTDRLIRDCEKANYNCIRVWGGGYYPDDYFYDACDERGIMIWQDLMFACNVYALNDGFEENITEETKDNVRRLRHHACLALWCGNNEMEWGWGDEWARIKGHHPRYKADYIKIFEYILPKALRSCDDETFFWPSSPSSGGSFDDPNGVNRGDQHYWEVWHSGKPFTEYRKNYFSFCSEYGFQSFPGMKTIESFTLPEDRNIFSQVMESHQKNGTANGKILGYIADYFLYPKSLSDLAYISQVLQLKAIQYGVEHWRRNRGRCMGSLYWQLNDSWPVASWASIDYYGRWKALHYGARRFYAPVMVSACEEEELSARIRYYVNNDTLEPINGTVEAALIDRDFQILWTDARQVTAEPMSVSQCMEADYGNWIPSEEKRAEVFARVRLTIGGKCISEQTTLFVKPKHFHYRKPQYQVQVREMENTFEICTKCQTFAQYVELDLRKLDGTFSDNYFDITSPEGVTVVLPKAELRNVAGSFGGEGVHPELVSCEALQEQIRVRSVADSYTTG